MYLVRVLLLGKNCGATTNNSCVAILYKGKVWTLGSKSGILEAFADKNIT